VSPAVEEQARAPRLAARRAAIAGISAPGPAPIFAFPFPRTDGECQAPFRQKFGFQV